MLSSITSLSYRHSICYPLSKWTTLPLNASAKKLICYDVEDAMSSAAEELNDSGWTAKPKQRDPSPKPCTKSAKKKFFKSRG